MDYDQLRDEEWNKLYEKLRKLLARHGKDGAYGNGDFWVVDDNYGIPQLKVCVSNISFLTRIMAMEVQKLLRTQSLPWEVIFVFDPRDERLDDSDIGLTVRKADIQEHWNAARLRKKFGNEFRWGIATMATRPT